jgi:hypothetical protein
MQGKRKTSPVYRWDTTDSLVTKAQLKSMYKAIPTIVINQALEDGVTTLEELHKRNYEHQKLCAKRIVEAQKVSTEVLKRAWVMGPSKTIDYRHTKDYHRK